MVFISPSWFVLSTVVSAIAQVRERIMHGRSEFIAISVALSKDDHVSLVL